jgi:hypothetical protein
MWCWRRKEKIGYTKFVKGEEVLHRFKEGKNIVHVIQGRNASLIYIQRLYVKLHVNPLTPELNPSAQSCLTRFLLGILLLEPCISLIYALKTNKYTNYSLS